MIETACLGSVRIPDGKREAPGLRWCAAPADLRRYILSVTAKLVESKVVGNLAVRPQAGNPNLEIFFLVGEGRCDEASKEHRCNPDGFWGEDRHEWKVKPDTASDAKGSAIGLGYRRKARLPANVSERQRTPANASERQRTSANVNERQRTSANADERQRTSTNVNERISDFTLRTPHSALRI